MILNKHFQPQITRISTNDIGVNWCNSWLKISITVAFELLHIILGQYFEKKASSSLLMLLSLQKSANQLW